LIVLASIFGLVVVVAVAGLLWINSNLLNPGKKDTYKGNEIKEITVDGFTFRDLNSNGKLDIYEDTGKSIDERADDLLSLMTPDEKLNMLKGTGMKPGGGSGSSGEEVPGAAGAIVSIRRLGIPSVILADGPAGLRISPVRKKDDKTYYCTAFPIGTLLASTWNTDLVENVGRAMGNEVLEYGVDVILGPGANIQRNPLCGRNFEYYSEDPVLTGNIGAAMVKGIESNGVGTAVKHFVANNQETNRYANDVIVSERALREIYLKGFEIIVKKSQPWSIMSSYNLVNGTYTSESMRLLTDILRNEWGFEGIVMTDWFGGQSPPAQIHAGNDLLEPGTNRQYKALSRAARSGALSEEDINTSVKRILKLILMSPKMKQYEYSNKPDLEAHALLTRHSAAEGMVLLKNDGSLPLKGIKNIALFGVTSYNFFSGGTGSGDVNEAYTLSLEEGLINAGYEVNSYALAAFEEFKMLNKETFKKKKGLAANLNSDTPPDFVPSDDLLAKCEGSSDIAIVTIGRNSGEGNDRAERDDFNLSADEQEMLQKVCHTYHGAGKKVVVVLNIGGVIETASWKEKPDAILLAWQGGQEGGNSASDILNGKVNPSGRLPMTFPVSLADHASSTNFPLDGRAMSGNIINTGHKKKPDAEKVKNIDYTNYKEGVYVGYRHFDENNVVVSYPFGYGLSYTGFEFESMDVIVADGNIDINVKVQNTGAVAGKEVVEIYVSKQDTQIDRPVQELKAFAKTPLLESGESAELRMNIPVSDLSYWSEESSCWTLEKGKYTINASASSRECILGKEIDL
jgi:beta-glucosidase